MSTVTTSRKRVPARRPHHRYKPIKVKRPRWLLRGILGAVGVSAGLVVWAMAARHLAPISNSTRNSFDAILVLGTPADEDGNPTPEQLARITEAVREYERGVAPRIVFTGGSAHNQYVEADVMARVAAAQGIPPSAIFVETKAQDTIQNACYSARLMEDHGWRTAEVVSSESHLPRAAMIFGHTPLEWRMHSAPSLQPGDEGSSGTSALETLKTIRYLLYASWAERCNG